MADGIFVSVDGKQNFASDKAFDDMEHALNRLDHPAGAQIMDRAIKVATGIARKKAREPNRLFVDRSGRLRASIRVQGVRRGNREFTNLVAGGAGALQAQLIEGGTQDRTTRGRGRRIQKTAQFRGRVEPRRFLESAVIETQPQMLARIISFGQGKLEEWAREARKNTGLKAR